MLVTLSEVVVVDAGNVRVIVNVELAEGGEYVVLTNSVYVLV